MSKNPHTIKPSFIETPNPFKGKGMKHPKCWVASDWAKYSWRELISDIIRGFSHTAKLARKLRAYSKNGEKLARRRASFLYNFLFVQKSTVSKDALVVGKWLRRWLTTPLFMLALLTWILWPHPTKTIYADPAPTPPGASLKVSMTKKLPATTLAEQPAVAASTPPPAPPPAPAPVAPAPVYAAPTIGCGADPMMAYIYRVESGCNTGAYNPGGCRGLGQACPGSKLPCSDSDWACQDSWFRSYAVAAYGSIYNAYIFRVNHNYW